MGRKSVKENKNRYQEIREELNLTREEASELLEFISDDRLEKIENEKTAIRPEEVLKMSEAYKKADLCNYYCSHECPIGQRYVPEVESKQLSQITLEMLATLNTLEKEKNRLIEITVDGIISEDEYADFNKIKEQLDEMSKTIASLQMWINNELNK
ncbi:MAG: helix-turn-helix transcriptional regulator [Erysipelotrichaceae bacterium]|nr:helix-turn-helix transcriptional regulator [Erysipelotrichaceae bacterium]